jgi:hypothetical protein
VTAGSRIAHAKRKRPNLSTHDRSSSAAGVFGVDTCSGPTVDV